MGAEMDCHKGCSRGWARGVSTWSTARRSPFRAFADSTERARANRRMHDARQRRGMSVAVVAARAVPRCINYKPPGCTVALLLRQRLQPPCHVSGMHRAGAVRSGTLRALARGTELRASGGASRCDPPRSATATTLVAIHLCAHRSKSCSPGAFTIVRTMTVGIPDLRSRTRGLPRLCRDLLFLLFPGSQRRGATPVANGRRRATVSMTLLYSTTPTTVCDGPPSPPLRSVLRPLFTIWGAAL